MSMEKGKIYLSCGHEDLIYEHGWPVYQQDYTREGNKAVRSGYYCTMCYINALSAIYPTIFPSYEEALDWAKS